MCLRYSNIHTHKHTYDLDNVNLLILSLYEFFSPVLAGGLPPEFEWHQVSLDLQNSSRFFVVLVLLILHLISNSSRPSFETVPRDLWEPFQERQFQLISPSPSCSTEFLVLWQGLSIYISLLFLWFSFCSPPEQQIPKDKFLNSLFA